MAGPGNGAFTVDNRAADGKIQPSGVARKVFANIALAQGQAVYVTKIEPKSDSLRIHVVTVETYDNAGDVVPFKAILSFRIAKNYFDMATPEDVEAMIDAFLMPTGSVPADAVTAQSSSPPPPASDSINLAGRWRSDIGMFLDFVPAGGNAYTLTYQWGPALTAWTGQWNGSAFFGTWQSNTANGTVTLKMQDGKLVGQETNPSGVLKMAWSLSKVSDPAPTPPVQPAAAQPAPVRIALGQTIDQVTAALGLPEQIADLGPKQIYRYKDLKITFVNGKVSDVQ